MDLKKLGFLSQIALVILIALFTVFTVDYPQLLSSLFDFFTGNPEAAKFGDQSLWDIVTILLALVVIDVFLTIVYIIVVQTRLHQATSYNHASVRRALDNGAISLFVGVLLEEVLARYFFLGFLTKLFTGDMAFYTLLVIGNSAWAFAHLSNYNNPKDRTLLRIMSQFLSGLLLAYTFVRFGFVATVAHHYVFNVVVFAQSKEHEVRSNDIKQLAYYFAAFVVCSGLMVYYDLPFSTIVTWLQLNGDVQFTKDLGVVGFMLMTTWASCGLSLVTSALLLDRKPLKKTNYPLLGNVALFLAAFGLLTLVTLSVGVFVESTLTTSLVTTLIFMLMHRSTSGSMLAAAIIDGPLILLLVATSIQLSVAYAFVLFVILAAVDYIPMKLRTV